jgi:alpha-galactosidase
MIGNLKEYRLDGKDLSVVFATMGDTLDLIYIGGRLPKDEDLKDLSAASQFGLHENQPDVPPVGGLLPEAKSGYAGRPAVRVRNDGHLVRTDFRLQEVATTGDSVTAVWIDHNVHLQVSVIWKLTPDDVITCKYCFTNTGEYELLMESISSLVLPLPARFDCVTSFPGRWAREMQETRHELGRGAIEMRSSGGKPGFDPGNWLLFSSGLNKGVIGCHICWNGDHLSHVEKSQDGRATLIMESILDADDSVLPGGGDLQSADTILTYALDQDELTRKFHRHVRDEILPRRAQWGPRKVHLNSWEALVFDLSEQSLMALADQAAALGVERFVLDDGWFKGRRSPHSGLGDWTVDADIFPEGLAPLIDHIKALGMDFGLWVEPEMISPDSDLYRNHPEWCIHDSSDNRPTERHQLVLDLSRPEVMEYLASSIKTLLDTYDIAYIKWDHNRRLFPSGTAQANGYYELLTAIANTNPNVEIENCSSGGGRVDLHSLKLAHRVWPSDNNDPIERLRINQSWTKFLPLEILGNHVGPSPNPISGRQTGMDFRAKVAMFGHMGVEANPADMTSDEREILVQHIRLYKQWRGILHSGQFWQLDHEGKNIFGQIVVEGNKAIAFASQTGFAEYFNVSPVRLKGLEPDVFYTVTLPRPWPVKASQYLADPDLWSGKLLLSGRALMEQGLALPLTHPETAWIITLEMKAKA